MSDLLFKDVFEWVTEAKRQGHKGQTIFKDEPLYPTYNEIKELESKGYRIVVTDSPKLTEVQDKSEFRPYLIVYFDKPKKITMNRMKVMVEMEIEFEGPFNQKDFLKGLYNHGNRNYYGFKHNNCAVTAKADKTEIGFRIESQDETRRRIRGY